jgi:hypothetical protein
MQNFRKPERKGPVEKPSLRLKKIIKIYFKERFESIMHSTGSG